MPDDELEKLLRAHTAKFDEICALLAAEHGEVPNPANLSDARRKQNAQEAERLIELWDGETLANWDLEKKATTDLRLLLKEHHEIGQQILDLRDKRLCL
jgi:hypothetical protein